MVELPSNTIPFTQDSSARRAEADRQPSDAKGRGDPMSLQPFVLAMEVITLLVLRATEGDLLAPIGRSTPVQRLSIYADDVVVFVKPQIQDLVVIRKLLRIFGGASGLQFPEDVCDTNQSRRTGEGDCGANLAVPHR